MNGDVGKIIEIQARMKEFNLEDKINGLSLLILGNFNNFKILFLSDVCKFFEILAIVNDQNEMAEYIINKISNINEQDEDGHSALHFCKLRYIICFLLCIYICSQQRYVAAVNAFDFFNFIGFSYANARLIKYLCSKQAKLNLMDKSGNMPIDMLQTHIGK